MKVNRDGNIKVNNQIKENSLCFILIKSIFFQLHEYDRCRKLYEKYLEFDPSNCSTWIKVLKWLKIQSFSVTKVALFWELISSEFKKIVFLKLSWKAEDFREVDFEALSLWCLWNLPALESGEFGVSEPPYFPQCCPNERAFDLSGKSPEEEEAGKCPKRTHLVSYFHSFLLINYSKLRLILLVVVFAP